MDNLFSAFVRAAARYPQEMAVRSPGCSLRFGELLEGAQHLAGYMQQRLGVRSGDAVLLYTTHGPHFVLACEAVWCCGGVVIAQDPRAAARGRARTRARVLFTSEPFAAQARAWLEEGAAASCVVGPAATRDLKAFPATARGLHDLAGALAAGIAPLVAAVDARAVALLDGGDGPLDHGQLLQLGAAQESPRGGGDGTSCSLYESTGVAVMHRMLCEGRALILQS